MKTNTVIFSVFFLLLIIIPQVGLTQESSAPKKKQRKIEKEKKKQEKEAATLAEREEHAQMLQDKQFIFMANTLAGDAGATFLVTPKFNFLKVTGDTVVFQFAFDGIVGWNGIGGITLKGKIENFQFDSGKNTKKPLRVNARVKANTQWGNLYFTLTVFGEGFANITMSGKGGTINMSGQLVSMEEASIYEGIESIYD